MLLSKFATISNILTMLRLILAPVVLFFLLKHNWYAAFIVVIVAFLSDLLDGLLARFFNEQTEFGALLDPIADKVFLTACIWGLVFIQHPLFSLPVWFFYLLLMRECIVVIGTTFLRLKSSLIKIEPTMFGKLSAAIQMIFIVWLFISYFLAWDCAFVNQQFMLVVVIVSLLSFIHYFFLGIRLLNASR